LLRIRPERPDDEAGPPSPPRRCHESLERVTFAASRPAYAEQT
jgi:hypothetical protein